MRGSETQPGAALETGGKFVYKRPLVDLRSARCSRLPFVRPSRWTTRKLILNAKIVAHEDQHTQFREVAQRCMYHSH